MNLALALAIALLPLSERALGVSAGEPRDAPFLEGDLDAEAAFERARALRERGHTDAACAFAAGRVSELSRAGAVQGFVADPSKPGHFFGAREALLRLLREAPPESRRRIASLLESSALAAFAAAASERDGEAAAETALRFPFTRAGSKALVLAADLRAEQGLLSEARDLLLFAGPDFAGLGADEAAERRLRFLETVRSGREPALARPAGLKLVAKVPLGKTDQAGLLPRSASQVLDVALVHSRGAVLLRSGSAPSQRSALLGSVVGEFGARLDPASAEAIPLPWTCRTLGPEDRFTLLESSSASSGRHRLAAVRLSDTGEPVISAFWEPWQLSPELNQDGFEALGDSGLGSLTLLTSRETSHRGGAGVKEYRLLKSSPARRNGTWTRFVCAGERTRERPHKYSGALQGPVALLEEGGVCCALTDCGLVAGFASFNGAPLWAVSYKRDRRMRTDLREAILGARRRRAPTDMGGLRLLSGQGWFAAAPADSTQVIAVPCRGGEAMLALNTMSGGIGNDFRTLVAFDRGVLLVGLQDRLVALDPAKRFGVAWIAPGRSTGLKGGFPGEPAGGGVVMGELCLFPTTAGVFAVDLATGALQPGCSLHFGWEEEDSVALVRAGGFLVAAGKNRMWVFSAE